MSGCKTKLVGDIAETAVMCALIKKGYTVSIPFGENSRYDLIVDIGGDLKKVQCKAGRLRKGAVSFRCFSKNSSSGVKNYIGQIDFFGVYCLQINACFLIPVAEATLTDMHLRLSAPKNNQKNKINLASKYEI